jgi:flagellar FliJ protein
MTSSSTRIESLHALLQQAEEARDAAVGELQRAQRESQAAMGQHEQLVSYRRDYEARYSAQFASAGSMEMLRCYQSFMQRLTQAVDQQQRVAQRFAERAAAANQALQQHEIRVASIRKLIERRAEENKRVVAQRERREADELAARSAGGGGAFPGTALLSSPLRGGY